MYVSSTQLSPLFCEKLMIGIYRTVLERLASLGGSSTKRFDDHQEDLSGNSTPASQMPAPSMDLGRSSQLPSSHANQDDGLWPTGIFPVLVGDEESISRVYRAPVPFLLDI